MKYEVVIAWYPVKVGDIIETDKLHDAIKPNVRAIAEEKPKEKEVEQPRRGRPPKDKE
jgi:hypothetical protein